MPTEDHDNQTRDYTMVKGDKSVAERIDEMKRLILSSFPSDVPQPLVDRLEVGKHESVVQPPKKCFFEPSTPEISSAPSDSPLYPPLSTSKPSACTNTQSTATHILCYYYCLSCTGLFLEMLSLNAVSQKDIIDSIPISSWKRSLILDLDEEDFEPSRVRVYFCQTKIQIVTECELRNTGHAESKFQNSSPISKIKSFGFWTALTIF